MSDFTDELLESELARAEMLDEYYDAVEKLKPGQALMRIMAEARNEAQAALVELVHMNPNEADKIRALQWKVTRQEALSTWIVMILENGKLANSDLTEEQQQQFQTLLKSETIKD